MIFVFNDTATTEIYTLSLHDALPIFSTAGSMVLGFSLTGATIPAGEGVLTILSLPDVPEAIINIVMSDAFGNQLDFTYLPSEGDDPSEFAFNQSTLQAAYFFTEVSLDGTPIESDDWVGAFNGDICVGSHQWDTSQCGDRKSVV